MSSSTPKFLSVAPVFSTTDLDRWLNHYKALGFAIRHHGDIYGFATRENVSIHVLVNANHDPLTTAGCAYIYVDDAKALHQAWSAVETGRNVAPVDTDYGLCEGAHLDPDNNLIRYGSRLDVVPEKQ
ncbi:hypothetical protein QBC38DRAFT_464072 [Podospora fimiseda]|uniref:VOC domain-containing protein n=1 Tax=Podospora fimiseda TaxID=252190 RepID=A0AAN7BZA6_9PEZI|nr:hypothetical protein QBC38DRAFT_464072 [Podospora fimiseda]